MAEELFTSGECKPISELMKEIALVVEKYTWEELAPLRNLLSEDGLDRPASLAGRPREERDNASHKTNSTEGLQVPKL